MTLIDDLARAVRQYHMGIITDREIVTKFSDCFAGDRELGTRNVAEIAALIPCEVRPLLIEQIDMALSPGYMRRAFAMGGAKRRSEEEEKAAALRETAREQAWATALKPLLS